MKFNCIIVEDEALAQQRMLELLKPFEKEINVLGSAPNGKDAIKRIEEHEPELLFLDIQLPDLSGFQVLARLSYQPMVIFTTAYAHYAIQAFENYSIDYLVKPFDSKRLGKAIKKLRNFGPQSPLPNYKQLESEINTKPNKQAAFALPIKIGDRIRLFDFDDLVYLKAEDKYVRIFLKNGETKLSERSLGKLEEQLPDSFIRIHRSYIVNRKFILEIQKYFKGNLILTMNDNARTNLKTGNKYVIGLKSILGL